MRTLLPLLCLVIGFMGCTTDPATDTDRPDASRSTVSLSATVEAKPLEEEQAAAEKDAAHAGALLRSGRTLPSQSKAVHPHVPGLSHVSIYLTGAAAE